jgi:hypothetical protein
MNGNHTCVRMSRLVTVTKLFKIYFSDATDSNNVKYTLFAGSCAKPILRWECDVHLFAKENDPKAT